MKWFLNKKRKEWSLESPDKKAQILNASVALLEKKGTKVKISEIAAGAGVNDSIIYHYFKDKEDLLFHTIGAYVKSSNDTFVEHMKAIRDPVSRLRKLIWDQLHYHDVNPNYTKLLLFYCRSQKSFFGHESFTYFLRWARELKKILEDGVRENIFSVDLPITVVQDMVLGYMDMENIDAYVHQRDALTEEGFEEIIDMFMFLLTDRENNPSDLGRREKILEASEAIFAVKDYHKATTVEIAKAAQVSEATLYEFFTNKEDILLSGLQYRLKGHIHIAEQFFDIRTPVSRLVRFIYYHFTMHVRQPSFVKNLILNGIFNENFYASTAYADFQRYMSIVDQIIEDGKADGSMRTDVDIRRFKHLLLGVFSHTVLRWFYSEDKKKPDMMGCINEVTGLLMKMVMKPNQTILGSA